MERPHPLQTRCAHAEVSWAKEQTQTLVRIDQQDEISTE
jgi:hypothetical protein